MNERPTSGAPAKSGGPRTYHHPSVDEPLVFEIGSPGRRAYDVPPLDVPETDIDDLLPRELRRDDIRDLPELSETDVTRHYTRLSNWNYHIDLGLYPLGSCTMKHNPRVNETVARFRGFTGLHPYLPAEAAQGALEVQKTLERCLAEITGMDAVTLHPAAGAHGELVGLLLIRAYHESKGRPRKTVLVPDSAHGTNPASVTMAGYEAQHVPSNAAGTVDLDHLSTIMNDDVAGIMITNPNTLGIFENEIDDIARLMHEHDALVYMDGANMNALMGITCPGDFGVDVLHLNLHKTFSTPHGGGGPGSGPVAVRSFLEPFLPRPVIGQNPDGTYFLDDDRPGSIGKIRAFQGHFGVHVRALAYLLANGAKGLREVSEVAVLNANYLRAKLMGAYDLPYDTPTLHEVVFSDKKQRENGVRVGDIGKRLMDYGFHAPTLSFPLIVSGAIMIEPTETESPRELDAFVRAMRAIAREAEEDPDLVKNAPHETRVGRLNETNAARHPVLRWRPEP